MQRKQLQTSLVTATGLSKNAYVRGSWPGTYRHRPTTSPTIYCRLRLYNGSTAWRFVLVLPTFQFYFQFWRVVTC